MELPSADADGRLSLHDEKIDTSASLDGEGRVNINIKQKSTKLRETLLKFALHSEDSACIKPKRKQRRVNSLPLSPASQKESDLPPPSLNIVIQIVGSRGDVQPFVALGKVLKEKHGHRVRLATHATFKDFVEENGLEFFNIGGSPNDMMSYMVKNPGLLPTRETMKHGEIARRREDTATMLEGCWRACIETGDGMGPPPEETDDASSFAGQEGQLKPFIADAIIANPPGFAHIHCAEKLGVPFHLMFTMPWSPTTAFPHPLANIQSSDADQRLTNFISYPLVMILTWQGLGDIINKFREETLGLEPVSVMWTPILATRSMIPFTYCWSPALIPKPKDWAGNITIAGFYFLSLASAFTPAPELLAFLEAGPPPVYIGFGSIVVDDPNALTKLIFEAVKKSGVRALVSKGWGGLGGDDLAVPENVFMLGNVPHDWLFKFVAAVVHHGGAGTTAAGIAAGKPTVVVPFFGDQPFWGSMVAKAGAGPVPVPFKRLTADILADSIQFACKPETLDAAKELGASIAKEDGAVTGAESFHDFLKMDRLRSSLDPHRTASWRIRKTKINLSAFAAVVLGSEGILDVDDLKIFRYTEYDLSDSPWDPISGGASAFLGTLGNFMRGVATLPSDLHRATAVPLTPTGSRTSSPRRHQSIQHFATSKEIEVRRDSIKSITASRTDSIKSVSTDRTDSILTTRTGRTESTISTLNSPSHQPHHHAITVDGARQVGRTVGKEFGHVIKFPREFTLALARGFHNAPKLYGDATVRQPGKVVGLGSGLKTAGKELFYGLYDGFTGLVTQPYHGAKNEGGKGFFKGLGKGVGGLLLKPEGAVLGLLGYTAEGVYRHMHKHAGKSIVNYVAAARIAQGYEEYFNSTSEERQAVIDAWNELPLDLKDESGHLHHRRHLFQPHSHRRRHESTDGLHINVAEEDGARSMDNRRSSMDSERTMPVEPLAYLQSPMLKPDEVPSLAADDSKDAVPETSSSASHTAENGSSDSDSVEPLRLKETESQEDPKPADTSGEDVLPAAPPATTPVAQSSEEVLHKESTTSSVSEVSKTMSLEAA